MPTNTVRCEVELVTDPIGDHDSERVISGLAGWQGFHGSPIADGIPYASRSRFVLARGELDAGWLEACLDHLAMYGIAVHRVHGEHPAVRRANCRLGYV
jgi:hypothetical protein